MAKAAVNKGAVQETGGTLNRSRRTRHHAQTAQTSEAPAPKNPPRLAATPPGVRSLPLNAITPPTPHPPPHPQQKPPPPTTSPARHPAPPTPSEPSAPSPPQ